MRRSLLKWLPLLVASFGLYACDHSTSQVTDEQIEYENSMKDAVPDGYLFYRDENTGHLKYIAFDGAITDSDFNILDSESVDLDLGLDCYHPEVSPDGKWVAFSTSHENSGAQSDLYVKRIGSPYPPQKLNAMSAAIPRWRVLPNGDTVIVYVDDTTVLPSKGMESDSEIQMRLKAWKGTGTWMVPFMGGVFGKSQKIADGAFNGGVTVDLDFMVTSSALLVGRHVVYNRDGSVERTSDTVWYDYEQTCNASLLNDGSKRTLFLDMSGKQGLAFAGESFRPHQRILVVDSLGSVVAAVPSPVGTAYDHTEWVGYQDYAVASLQDANLLHTKIVLVNMKDSSVTDLVSGGELWHPNLWIKK